LAIQFGDRLLQHLAMTWIADGLKLLSETLAGKKQAVALAVAFLFAGGDRSAGGFLPL
jgi:hypothetical protein